MPRTAEIDDEVLEEMKDQGGLNDRHGDEGHSQVGQGEVPIRVSSSGISSRCE